MSLRLRLLLAVGAVALLALIAADTVTYRQLSSSLYRRVDQTLDQEHFAIEREIHGGGGRGPHGNGGGGGGGDHRDPGGPIAGAPGAFFTLLDASGKPVGGEVRPAYVPGGKSWTPELPAALTGFRDDPGPGGPRTYLTVGSVEAGGPSFRIRAEKLSDGSTLVVGNPLSDVESTLNTLLTVEIVVTVGALVVAGALGWWLVRRGLRPLTEVQATADAITAGDLDRRVPGDDARTEVGHVALALNTMLTRIQSAFAERDATEAKLRRFVADASHELRTPLAAVSAYAELFERGARERPQDLARVISGIRVEADRMGRLVQDLLLLARLDEGRPLEREPVDLVALAHEAADTSRTVSAAWPVSVDANGPVEVMGDEGRLRQVFDNLLSNVRAHTPTGTVTHITVASDDGFAVVGVADNGPGMTEDESQRVFERFYRVDPSRSREHGGAGLGLGIVAAIVQAHGGRVAAAQTPGGGATFTVSIPLG
jgi:two-component system OmpR family sensor kinase